MLKHLIERCEKCKSVECLNYQISEIEVSELIKIKNKVNEAIELIQNIPGNQTTNSMNARKLHSAYNKLYKVKQILG